MRAEPNSPIPRSILDAVHGALGGLPGVDITKIGWHDEPATGMSPRRRALAVEAWAWDVALCKRHRTWKQDIGKALMRRKLIADGNSPEDADDAVGRGVPASLHPMIDAATDEDCADALRTCLATVADVQRMLIRHAENHGITDPLLRFYAESPERTAGSLRMLTHLDTHRPLLDACVQAYGVTAAVDTMVAALERSLSEDSGRSDDALAASDGHAGIDLLDGRPTLWWLHLFERPDRKGPSVTFSGSTLYAPIDLPETASTSAVGRKVGDLVSTGVATLDGMTVEDVSDSSVTGVIFDLIHDLVPVMAHTEAAAEIARQLQEVEK